MNKELEEAIKVLKRDINTPLACGDTTIVCISDLETVLNYIENSISKEEYNKIKEENEEYKKQSWENEITNLIYKNLRKCFNNMVDRILGEKYYNMGMDTYTCDKLTCEDIINKKVKIIFKDNNSISKEAIKEKKKQIQQEYSKLDKEVDEYINDSNKDLTKYYENKLKIDTMQILSWVIEIFEELLEGK